MAFCSKCGSSLDPNAQFCASCGAAVNAAQPNPSSQPPNWDTPPVPTVSTQMQRPTGVVVLAILAAIGGLGLLGFGAVAGSFLGFFLPGVGFGLSILFVIFALIQFGIAYGFWVGASWAWWLGIIGAVLQIISIIGLDVIGLVIGIIMLYYLTRPHVKMWFHTV
jgi:hypothetical protein